MGGTRAAGGGSSACLAAMPGRFPCRSQRPVDSPLQGPQVPPEPSTDLSPLQHLPFVQHFHGKNLPTVPLPHHSNLRPQRALGSRRSGGKHLFPPPTDSRDICSPPRRPLGRSPSRSQSHLSAAAALSPLLRRDRLRAQSGAQRACAEARLPLACPPTRPGQGRPPQRWPLAKGLTGAAAHSATIRKHGRLRAGSADHLAPGSP